MTTKMTSVLLSLRAAVAVAVVAGGDDDVDVVVPGD